MLKVINDSDCSCLSCMGKKEVKEVKISRKIRNEENIVSFNLCIDCLRELALEFKPYS